MRRTQRRTRNVQAVIDSARAPAGHAPSPGASQGQVQFARVSDQQSAVSHDASGSYRGNSYGAAHATSAFVRIRSRRQCSNQQPCLCSPLVTSQTGHAHAGANALLAREPSAESTASTPQVDAARKAPRFRRRHHDDGAASVDSGPRTIEGLDLDTGAVVVARPRTRERVRRFFKGRSKQQASATGSTGAGSGATVEPATADL